MRHFYDNCFECLGQGFDEIAKRQENCKVGIQKSIPTEKQEKDKHRGPFTTKDKE